MGLRAGSRGRTAIVWSLFVPLCAAGVGFSTPRGTSAVAYDSDPAAVVVSFHETLGEVADPDPGPSLEVFGDGRIAVHYPRYMVRAGDWADRLSPGALQDLVRSLVDEGVLDLDESTVRANLAHARAARRAAARRGEATLFEASDASTTTILLRADGREHRVTWHGIRADAYAHPDVPEVQALRRAHDTVRQVMERPTLRPER